MAACALRIRGWIEGGYNCRDQCWDNAGLMTFTMSRMSRFEGDFSMCSGNTPTLFPGLGFLLTSRMVTEKSFHEASLRGVGSRVGRRPGTGCVAVAEVGVPSYRLQPCTLHWPEWCTTTSSSSSSSTTTTTTSSGSSSSSSSRRRRSSSRSSRGGRSSHGSEIALVDVACKTLGPTEQLPYSSKTGWQRRNRLWAVAPSLSFHRRPQQRGICTPGRFLPHACLLGHVCVVETLVGCAWLDRCRRWSTLSGRMRTAPTPMRPSRSAWQPPAKEIWRWCSRATTPSESCYRLRWR